MNIAFDKGVDCEDVFNIEHPWLFLLKTAGNESFSRAKLPHATAPSPAR
jgi:hypothetical protein